MVCLHSQSPCFWLAIKDIWERPQSAYEDCWDSPGRKDGTVFSLRVTTSASPTLRCAGNVFAGSIFACAAAPAKQEYPIQIPVYVSLDIVPLTQVLKCTQISCFTSSQNKDVEQLNMPLANIRELGHLPGSMAPWLNGHGEVTDTALRKLCLWSFFLWKFC